VTDDVTGAAEPELPPPEPPDTTPSPRLLPLGTRQRLKGARQEFAGKKMLLSPSRRGALGCAMTGVNAAAAGAAIIALAAPCAVGTTLGLFGALAGILCGALIGIPLLVVVSNAAKTVALEGTTATLDQPQLPESGGGGTTTSVAVAPGQRDDPP